MESVDFTWQMAHDIKAVCDRLGVGFVFKASYDKANRTSVSSFRGIGVSEGSRLLGQIGEKLGVPVTTDVHSEQEAQIAAEYVDILQIPAFLCRQTSFTRRQKPAGL